jgi:hypothetical protein
MSTTDHRAAGAADFAKGAKDEAIFHRADNPGRLYREGWHAARRAAELEERPPPPIICMYCSKPWITSTSATTGCCDAVRIRAGFLAPPPRPQPPPDPVPPAKVPAPKKKTDTAQLDLFG